MTEIKRSSHKKRDRTVSTLRRLLRAMWNTPGAFMAALVSTIMITAFDVSIPLLTGSAVDIATGELPGSLKKVIIILIGVALTRYVFQFARRYTAGRLSQSVQYDLRLKILESLLHLDGPAQDRLQTGQVISRSISDLNSTQGSVAVLPLITGHILKLLAIVAVIIWISPALSILALILIPVLIGLTLLSRKTLFAATWSSQQAVGELSTHVEETITGVRIVKAFAQEDRETHTLNGLARRVYALMMRQAKLQAKFQPLVQQLPVLATVFGIGIGGYLTLHGHISVGSFFAFSAYLGSLTSVTGMVAGLIIQLQLGYASAQRVFDVIDEKPDVPDPVSTNALAALTAPLGISMRNVNFAMTTPAGKRNQVLKDFTLTVRPDETVALVGPPGSGKTVATTLLTDFYSPDSGTIALTDKNGCSISYKDVSRAEIRQVVTAVFDDPFLFSASIRDNIIMGRTVSDEELEAAARGAQAHEFISELPGGYDEVVGERGLTLSGGQRQRIAIARALLAQPDVLILDDATSAIDATTERAIYNYLRTNLTATTIVAIAHRTSTLELANRIALIENGHVTEVGPPEQMRENSSFMELMALKEKPQPDISVGTGTDIPWAQLWPSQSDTAISHSTTQGQQRAQNNPRIPGVGGKPGGMGKTLSAAASTPASPELLARIEKLPPATATPPTDGTAFMKPASNVRALSLFSHVKWLIVGVIALYAVSALAGLAIPTLIRFAIDLGVIPGNESVLWIVMAVGFLVVFIAWLSSVASTILSSLTGERLLYELRVRSYAHLQRLGMDYYEKTMSGTILTRMTTDIDALNSFLQNGLATFVVSLSTLVGILILLSITSLQLSLIAIAGIPLIALATVIFRRISSTLYFDARDEVTDVNALFHETIAGLRTTQLYGITEQKLTQFAHYAKAYRDTRIKAQAAVATYFPGINAVSELVRTAVLGVGAGLVSAGQIQAGVLVAFLLYLDRFYSPIQQLSQVFDSYQQAQVGFTRISELLATPTPANTTDTGNPSTTAARTAASGNIDFHDVSFSYDSDTAPITEHLNLHVQSGTTTAIVGATGAGKSTIIKLIERFYEPNTGEITANGENIAAFNVQSWRRNIGFVPQEAHLFSGTIAYNIAYGKPDASEDEITEAMAHVGGLPAIAAIPGGFTAYVGEGGRGLSSGQRQLIALARAEMIKPRIMLLDEATATLDPATELVILDAADKVTNDRTSFIVAHRLATAARADRILVVEKGEIVEDGTHDELLTFGGRYSTMWGK